MELNTVCGGLGSEATFWYNRIIDSFAYNYVSAITSRGLESLKGEVRYCYLLSYLLWTQRIGESSFHFHFLIVTLASVFGQMFETQ